jgi:hypothetical protein
MKREALYNSQGYPIDLTQNFSGAWYRVLADRDFIVVAAFVIIGLLASLYLIAFGPWSAEIGTALSALS